MTKIQILAKVEWNGLMLYFLGLTLSMVRVMPPQKSGTIIFDSFPCLAMCACAGLLLQGCYAIRLPLRLFGLTAFAPEPDWKPFFIQTHRLACVFVGLVLLSRHLKAVGSAINLLFWMPSNIRSWFTLCVEGNWDTALGQTAAALQSLFYPFGFLLFCFYLLIGADGFVRRQANRFETCQIKESCNE